MSQQPCCNGNEARMPDGSPVPSRELVAMVLACRPCEHWRAGAVPRIEWAGVCEWIAEETGRGCMKGFLEHLEALDLPPARVCRLRRILMDRGVMK